MSDLSITKYFPFMRVKITKQTVHHEDASSTMIKFEPDRRYRPFCHTCEAVVANIHSHGYRRFIIDLNMVNAQTWLHIGTSQLESANNKIKVIKRKAYGFHDLKYFTLKVKQAFAA